MYTIVNNNSFFCIMQKSFIFNHFACIISLWVIWLSFLDWIRLKNFFLKWNRKSFANYNFSSILMFYTIKIAIDITAAKHIDVYLWYIKMWMALSLIFHMRVFVQNKASNFRVVIDDFSSKISCFQWESIKKDTHWEISHIKLYKMNDCLCSKILFDIVEEFKTFNRLIFN